MIKHRSVPVDTEHFDQLPFPYDWLVGAPAYSPYDGRGWLGLDRREDCTVLWFVSLAGGARPLDYDSILFHQDRQTSNMWLVFLNNGKNEAYPYVIHPDDGVGVHHIPRKLKEIINNGK